MKPVILDSSLLAQVQQVVAEALTNLDAREQALATLDATEAAWPAPLAACRERIGALEQHAGGVAEALQRIDAFLADEETNLRAFLTRAEQMRHRLAEWAARAIG